MTKSRLLGIILFLCSLQAGSLLAQSYSSIRSIKAVDANGVALNNGKNFSVKGILIGPTIGIPGKYGVSVYDSTGAVCISLNLGGFNLPTVGDSVEVRGKIFQILTSGNSGLTVLTDTLDIKKIGSGKNTIKKPAVIQKLSEYWESDYVQLDSLTLLDTKQWTSGGTAGFALIQALKGMDTVTLRVSNFVINQVPRAPSGLFNVRGIVYQNDLNKPYLGNYRIGAWDQTNFDFLNQPPIRLYPIGAINKTDANGVLDSFGLKCAIKGIINSRNLSTSLNQSGIYLPIQDSTGALTIYYSYSNFGNNFVPGDSLLVYGTVNQQWGLATVVPDSIFIINSGNKKFAAAETQTLDEKLESHLVKLMNVHLTRQGGWDTVSRYNKIHFFCYITQNGVDSILVDVSRYTSAYYMQPPTGNFNITAIEGQVDFSKPYLTGYYLILRDSNDIESIPEYIPLLPIGSVKLNDAFGLNLAAKQSVRCYLKGVVHSGNIGGQGLLFSLEDNTGAISVYNKSNSYNYLPVIGDSVLVRGKIIQRQGLSLVEIDSIRRISEGNRTYKPSVVYNLTEQNESYPVTISYLKLIDSTQWANTLSPGGFWCNVTDSLYQDTIRVWVADNTGISSMPPPNGYFNLTGVVLQKDDQWPLFSGYYLAPWAVDNFELLDKTGIFTQKTGSLFSLYPNPATNTVFIQSSSTGEVSVYNEAGAQVLSLRVQKEFPLNMDISALNPGPYFFRFQNSNSTSSCIIIKK
jgi:hypothetical protein